MDTKEKPCTIIKEAMPTATTIMPTATQTPTKRRELF